MKRCWDQAVSQCPCRNNNPILNIIITIMMVTVRFSLFLGLSVHVVHVVVVIFLIAALLSGWHVRGGRNHSGLAGTGIAV